MNLLLFFIIPILLGYVIYKMMTYDWSKHEEDSKHMGDDMW